MRTVRMTLLSAGVALLSACSSSPKLQGEGGACFQVSDCALGLVCVPESGSSGDGPRFCSRDTSALLGSGPVITSDAGSPPGPDAGGATSDSGDEAPAAPSGD